jgi:processive 1,2-diacylglycerol beta-glucosyltransferase
MNKRILVLSASVGAGHLRAAQAVELALREIAPEAIVKNVDVLELTNQGFQRLYGKAYLDLVNLAPHVLGFFYDYMDRPRTKSRRDKLRAAFEKLNLLKLCDLLECQRWDVVVNTHFLPAQIIAGLRKKRKIATPHITVTTDFMTHRAWMQQPCERYTTATEEGAIYLSSFGVDRSIIAPVGIPIHPVFSREKDRGQCLKKHGLKGDRPVILQSAGGFGVGPIRQLFEAILSIEQPIEVVCVAGRNEKVRKQLQSVAVPPRHRATILGYTTEMDELMCAADIVVSKPGGLTSSEVLARGAALAIVNPIPGQESRNSDYLLESGAAVKISNIATMPAKLQSLLSDPQRLHAIQSKAQAIAKPRAAFDVAEIALNLGRRGGV